MNLKLKTDRAISLIELVVAMVILSVIVLYFSTFENIGRKDVTIMDRKSKVQNEAAYIMSHISKNIISAIGNEKLASADSVVDLIIHLAGQEDYPIRFYVDTNQNGIRETAQNTDYWSIYRYVSNPPALLYCRQCKNNNSNCTPGPGGCDSPGWETVSNKITAFVPKKPIDDPPTMIIRSSGTLSQDYVEIDLTVCQDPSSALGPCGSTNNPSVSMQTKIRMPCVSVN